MTNRSPKRLKRLKHSLFVLQHQAPDWVNLFHHKKKGKHGQKR